MLKTFWILLTAALLGVMGGPGHAAGPAKADIPWFGGQFSAKIVMVNPMTNAKGRGKLHVGNYKLRAEGVYNRKKTILIIDTINRTAHTLFPDDKQYYKGLGNVPLPPKPDVDMMPTDPNSPCNTEKSVTCHRQRVIKLPDGSEGERWEIRTQQQNQSIRLSLLVNTKRRVILQHQMVNGKGPAMERLLAGYETIEDRKLEKWNFVQTLPGRVMKYTQWVDPNLLVPVKVEGDQKFLAELTEIKEGPQPDDLFVIPEGYEEIPTPKRERPEAPPAQYQ